MAMGSFPVLDLAWITSDPSEKKGKSLSWGVAEFLPTQRNPRISCSHNWKSYKTQGAFRGEKNHEENLIYFSCISLEVLSIMRAAVIASELINWLFHSIKASPLYWYSKDGRAGWVSKNLCRKSSNTWEFSPSGDGKQSQGKSQSTHGKSQIHILLLEYSPALCTVLFQDISVLTPQL